MRIREYTPADLDALRELHARQSFGYPFPDVDSPLFITKLILEDDAGGESRTGSLPRGESRGSLSPFSDSSQSESGGLAKDREAAESREEAHPNSPPAILRAGLASPAAPSRAHSPRIRMAVLLRLTAEAYLLHDPAAGTPRERWQHFLALHEAVRHSAAARGLDDVQAFLPPRIARAFGRRLARLGWRQDPWACFSRSVDKT